MTPIFTTFLEFLLCDMADTSLMNSDENPKNYFQHDEELTVDGTPYKKESFLAKSYIVVPLIFMTLLLIGSGCLLASM